MTVRVLLVEDELDLQVLLSVNLEHLDGVELVGISSGGLDAVEKASQLQPDVIILDLMVHNPGGPRLVPLLRKVTGALIYIWSAFDLMRKTLGPQVDGWYSKLELNRMLVDLEDLPPDVPDDNVS